jgi:DNA-binding response OmpR family regulator
MYLQFSVDKCVFVNYPIKVDNNTQKKLLIVDDEEALLDALKDKFSHEGYVVLTARDGQEGLEIALKEHPACILADVVMPKMDGVSMLKKLREDEWGKTANVIVLTNLSNGEFAKDAVDAKVSNYLVKTDWSISELAEKVKNSIQSPQS